jgi:hypothetical protein
MYKAHASTIYTVGPEALNYKDILPWMNSKFKKAKFVFNLRFRGLI